MADRLHAPWTALSIETRRSLELTDEQRDRLADTLRLAEALGGEALTIPGVGRRIADDIVSFAQASNVTQIIIGKSMRSWWFEIRRGSVVHDLVRRSGNISVNVIAGEELAAEPVPKKTVRSPSGQSRSIRFPTGYPCCSLPSRWVSEWWFIRGWASKMSISYF
jgi:two-component system sensor histidine kinase KdpD